MTRIAIFSNQADAQAYSDKIHAYLQANRPNYNAVKWCDPEMSADGKEYFVSQPIEEEVQKWDVAINTATEKAKAAGITEVLPESGNVVAGQYYLHKGDVLKCRQTHNRTIYEPKDTPALFSFFRDNSDQLEWIAGEQVEVGWMRIFNGIKYEVIQSHQTQSDWTPDKTTALWKVYSEVAETPIETIEPWHPFDGNNSSLYQIGDKCTFEGFVWESKINNNSWSPSAYPAGWTNLGEPV